MVVGFEGYAVEFHFGEGGKEGLDVVGYAGYFERRVRNGCH